MRLQKVIPIHKASLSYKKHEQQIPQAQKKVDKVNDSKALKTAFKNCSLDSLEGTKFTEALLIKTKEIVVESFFMTLSNFILFLLFIYYSRKSSYNTTSS